MNPETDQFAEEERTFEAHRREWVQAAKVGQWVAILKTRVLGPLPSLDAIWDAAVATLDRGFMIKQIFETDRPVIVSNFEMTEEDPAA